MLACVALPQNGLGKHGAGEAAADRSQGSHIVVLNICLTMFVVTSFFFNLVSWLSAHRTLLWIN